MANTSSSVTVGILKSSWAGSGDALKKKYGTIVKEQFLDPMVQRVGILPFLTPQNVPKKSGDNMLFRRIATDTTIMAVVADGENAALSNRTIKTVEVALVEYGKAHPITKRVKRTGIGPLMEQLRKQVGYEAARDVDDYVYRTIGPLNDGCLPRMDSLAGNHQIFVTTSAGTTTTIVSTELTQADDYWNQGAACMFEGPNAGDAAFEVNDFTNSTGTITLTTAMEYAPGSGNRGIVSRNVGHTANDPNDILASGHFSKVMVQFIQNGAMTFDGSSLDEYLNVKENPLAGHFVAGTTPGQYDDFWGDPDFKAVATQGDAWKPNWSNYAMRRWKGFAIFNLPRQMRLDNPATAGTAEATTFQSNGAVHLATFLAQDAVSAAKLAGEGSGKGGIIIRYKTPGPNTTDQPTDGYDVLSVEIYFATLVTCGPWGINFATTSRN